MDKTKVKKEVSGKVSSAKSDKDKHNLSNGKRSSEKKGVDHPTKKYVIIPPESISSTAESIGISKSDCSEDAFSGLAEDVSYKLREVVHKCCILLHNNKRRKLTTEDVNRVFETSDTPLVYGHSVSHDIDFVPIPKTDIFVEEDVEVDIVAMSYVATAFLKPGEEYVKGTWLLPDPVEKAEPQGREEASTSRQEAGAPPPRPPAPTPAPTPAEPHGLAKPPPHFINYYLQVARVIIGGSEPHLRVALADLKTNGKIGPLVPYLLNLVALSVNKLQRNGRLTDALLRTIDALVDNPHVDPSSQLAVNRAVNALLVVAIEPKAAKNCDDLLLRKRAAQLLAKVLFCWSIELKQQMDIVRQLLQLLLDGSISLKSHYGAVVSLTALGQRTLDSYFWPILERYVSVLEEQKTSPADQADVHFVKGAIMIAVEKMYKRRKNVTNSEDIKRRLKVEQKLYEFLGDALVPRYNLRAGGSSAYPGRGGGGRGAGSDSCEATPPSRPLLPPPRPPLPLPPHPLPRMPKLHMYSVFSLSPRAFTRPKEIVFNFSGSNQTDPTRLRRRPLGQTLQCEFRNNHYRFAQLCGLPASSRKTRSVKYCSRSHVKSSTGDLFAFI